MVNSYFFKILIFLCFVFLLATSTHAKDRLPQKEWNTTSFDCQKSSLSEFEKKICDDPELKNLDRWVNFLHHFTLDATAKEKKPALALEQNQWMDNLAHASPSTDPFNSYYQRSDFLLKKNGNNLLNLTNTILSMDPMDAYFLSFVIEHIWKMKNPDLSDWNNGPTDFKFSEVKKLGTQKYLFLLCVNSGIGRYDYKDFIIETKGNRLDVEVSNLPTSPDP